MLTIQNNPDITLKSNERMLIALRALAKEEGQTTPASHNARVNVRTIEVVLVVSTHRTACQVSLRRS